MCMLVEASTSQPRLSREDIPSPGGGVTAHSPGDSNAPLMLHYMRLQYKPSHVS